MAYTYLDSDGDEAIRFEHGKWDSVMGYQCPRCGAYIGDPIDAMEHENTLPCERDPEGWRGVIWTGRIRL